MKSNRATVYLSLAWIMTIAIAYMVGWWNGVKNTTHVVTGAAHSGIDLVLILLGIVAVIAGAAAFRARGYLDSRKTA